MNVENPDDGRRAAIGYPDSCAYCFNKPGEPHRSDCHVPQKTVVVELKVRMVIEMPRVWDKDMMEFCMNESSACSSRYFDQLYLEANQEENLCSVCQRTDIAYLRDATEKDHENLCYVPYEKRLELSKKLLKEG